MHPLRQPSHGPKQNEKEANQHRFESSFEVGVEAWKFAGGNSKGFSPINVPN